jgi:hypothetical protein
MFQTRTIRRGQRVAVWDDRGHLEMVDGPRRLWLWGRTIEDLMRYSADNHQYIVVNYNDGRVEHLRGPAAVWWNPVEHLHISLADMIELDANEAVVVYRQEAKGVHRRVVRGPELFMPEANEWLHQFAWHGSDRVDTGKKRPGALRFTKLRVIPDQMYYDVAQVRTADDALLTVQVMIFFELVDIDRMLDQTHDPIVDFINSLSADVIDFVAAHTFEKFKEKTERLNDMSTYPQLTQRAHRIGYEINKVVYRGYLASDALQAMHDNAIEARTHLKLEDETQRQAQELEDMKMERELLRATARRQSEEEATLHQVRLAQLDHEEKLRQRRASEEQRIEHKRLLHQVSLEHQQAMNREQAAFLGSIRDMQVDLTRYLVAQYQHPDRLIRVDGQNHAQLHLHE